MVWCLVKHIPLPVSLDLPLVPHTPAEIPVTINTYGGLKQDEIRGEHDSQQLKLLTLTDFHRLYTIFNTTYNQSKTNLTNSME